MKIFEESIRPSEAWMLSYDGDAIPCYVHPFGDKDSDAIEDAAWLHCNTGNWDMAAKYVFYTCQKFIEDFQIETVEGVEECRQDIVDTINECECLKGVDRRRVDDFIDDVIEFSKDLLYGNISMYTDSELLQVEKSIKDYLNNNYLRVRYGSEYQTQAETPGALYFRISSTGRDWYDQIMQFCLELSEKRPIKTVTIERDKASTGSDKVYIDHMTWDEFLFKKKFIVDSLKRGVQD